MSRRANYFKLGLFVIGGVIAVVVLLVVIGSGRAFQQKITIETYFNESVQGLDIGSKVKYRGVVIGEVTKITFTYVKYQQDIPMSDRLRYVLVEAQLQPKLLGGKQAAEITGPEAAKIEVARGLRVRSAPQGITGTNYLEIDYVEPPPALLPIDWTPDYVYIPSAPGTVTALVNAASDIMEKLRKLDLDGTMAHLDTLLVTTNEKIAAIDTKSISQRTDRVLAKLETKLDEIAAKKLSDEAVTLMAELRESNAELKKILGNPKLQKLPDDAAAAVATVKNLVTDPKLAKAIGNMERSAARIDRILGGGEADLANTIENLRQITDNLRDVTEEAKRYPSNIFFGAPPAPAGAQAMTSRPMQRLATGARRAAAVAAVAMIAAATGCSLSRPSPVKDTYLLDPASPPVAATHHPGSLRVGTINVAAQFRARNFVIRDSDLKYESDFYREFFVPPNVMLADYTARALRVAQVFARVTRPGASLDAEWVLDGFAGSLYADLRDPAKPQAVIQITYYLSHDDGGATAPVWVKAYRKASPYKTTGGDAYVEALNVAFSEILADLARDLAAAELPAS